MDDTDKLAQEVTAVFDSLAKEVYYGMNFRMTIMENPELLRPLQEIVNKVEFARSAKIVKKLMDNE